MPGRVQVASGQKAPSPEVTPTPRPWPQSLVREPLVLLPALASGRAPRVRPARRLDHLALLAVFRI